MLVLWNAHAASLHPNSLPSRPTAKTSQPVSVKHLPEKPAATGPVGSAQKAGRQNDSGVLDKRRQFALSMIESGVNDDAVGQAGEVSRYQIMPSVWRHYTGSRQYRDPFVSLSVARQHWADLYASFKRRAHREPSDFDMYVLWNTRYGYYARHDFKPARLSCVVRDRAQRFVNLVALGSGPSPTETVSR